MGSVARLNVDISKFLSSEELTTNQESRCEVEMFGFWGEDVGRRDSHGHHNPCGGWFCGSTPECVDLSLSRFIDNGSQGLRGRAPHSGHAYRCSWTLSPSLVHHQRSRWLTSKCRSWAVPSMNILWSFTWQWETVKWRVDLGLHAVSEVSREQALRSFRARRKYFRTDSWSKRFLFWTSVQTELKHIIRIQS